MWLHSNCTSTEGEITVSCDFLGCWSGWGDDWARLWLVFFALVLFVQETVLHNINILSLWLHEAVWQRIWELCWTIYQLFSWSDTQNRSYVTEAIPSLHFQGTAQASADSKDEGHKCNNININFRSTAPTKRPLCIKNLSFSRMFLSDGVDGCWQALGHGSWPCSCPCLQNGPLSDGSVLFSSAAVPSAHLVHESWCQEIAECFLWCACVLQLTFSFCNWFGCTAKVNRLHRQWMTYHGDCLSVGWQSKQSCLIRQVLRARCCETLSWSGLRYSCPERREGDAHFLPYAWCSPQLFCHLYVFVICNQIAFARSRLWWLHGWSCSKWLKLFQMLFVFSCLFVKSMCFVASVISLPIHVVQKREQKKELGQVNGLVDKSGKRTTSPTSDADLLDRSSSSIRANAHARILERRASRPGTPTSNASTETPNSEQNDVDEDIIDVDDDSAIAEMDCGQPQLKRPFELLIAAAMERNPTQFQLPNELTCTTALPGEQRAARCVGGGVCSCILLPSCFFPSPLLVDCGESKRCSALLGPRPAVLF